MCCITLQDFNQLWSGEEINLVNNDQLNSNLGLIAGKTHFSFSPDKVVNTVSVFRACLIV